MLCKEIMKSDVMFVGPDTTVLQAAILMRDELIGFLPVCNSMRKVVGTLTDRDIAVRVVAENLSPEEPVERFMTPDVVACQSADDLSVAQDLMGEMQVSRIVCLSQSGGLEGIISLSDIAQVGDGTDATATLRSVTVREARV